MLFRSTENKPPLGVGLDLRRVVALDADLAEGSAWQDLVPSNRETAGAS